MKVRKRLSENAPTHRKGILSRLFSYTTRLGLSLSVRDRKSIQIYLISRGDLMVNKPHGVYRWLPEAPSFVL